jgi:hypothetical protein
MRRNDLRFVQLAFGGHLLGGSMTISTTNADQIGQPATLHGVMQAMVGDGLRRHYQAPAKLSHELFVLLLQLREEEQKQQPRAASQPRRRRALLSEAGAPR